MLAVICLLILALMWSLIKSPVSQQQEKVISQLLQQNQELLNRLQAPDLKTFLALQTSSNPTPDSNYIPMDDESEAERLRKIQPQPLRGFGEALDDEDIKAYAIQDFGNYSNIPSFYEPDSR